MIVIVGGAGFIGSRLGCALAAAGEHVRLVDIVPPPDDAWRCTFERRDIRDPLALAGAFDGARAVVHCAALLRRLCDQDPIAGWATNVAGSLHVFRAAAAAGARIVFLSTGGVYDRPERLPADERAPVAPRDLYVASKLAGEAMAAAAAFEARVTAVVVRLFTVYGPGPASGRRGHFLAHWLERATAGEPLVIHGEGAQTIDATHVDDVVRGLRAAIDLPLPVGACRTFNLGSGRETAVREVADWLREIAPGLDVRRVPMPASIPERQFADITLARATLGYAPQIAPRDGVRALAESVLT